MAAQGRRKAEQKRLNGFQARCLRKVLGIPHPYISRVSNEEVLRQADEKPLYHELLRRQMMLYGKEVRMPASSLQRQAALTPESSEPAVWQGKRSRGRPRQIRTTSVYEHVKVAFGDSAEGAALVEVSAEEWKKKVSTYMMSLDVAEESE